MTDLERTAGARDLAQDVAVYYNTLLGNGVSEEAALDLTHGYLLLLFGPTLGWTTPTADDVAAQVTEKIGPVVEHIAHQLREARHDGRMTTVTYMFRVAGHDAPIAVSYVCSEAELFDPAFDPKAPAVALLQARTDIAPDADIRIVGARRTLDVAPSPGISDDPFETRMVAWHTDEGGHA